MFAGVNGQFLYRLQVIQNAAARRWLEFAGLENDEQENAELHEWGLTLRCLQYILLTALLLL